MILAVLASLHLVYHYKIGAVTVARGSFGPANASFDRATGNAGGNSAMNAMVSAGNGREGTISVEIVQQNQDKTVVYSVREDGGKAYLCAVSGDAGDTLCDVDARFGDQTLILLRLLAPAFFDPSRLDKNGHWSTLSSGNGFSETADFTLTNSTAPLKTIKMNRQAQQHKPEIATSITGTVDYDAEKHAVTSLRCQITITGQDPGAPPPATTSLEIGLTGG